VNLKSSAILIVLCLPAVIAGKSDSRELASAERKFAHIETNGRSSRPNPAPTILTEAEVNAYLASDNISLPAGVQSVKLEGDDGVVTGNTRVDFDRIREGAHSSNPLLSIFSGVHEVVVVVHAHGSGGRGQVHVDSVSLDTIEVPRFVLQLFVDKFLKPKYPELGLDSEFALPDRIDMATVGKHELTIVQK
jgi:hypothetical protein